MNTKSVHAGRELDADELNNVSGGKGLEAQDRLGNFEIQRLMSSFNQAETLAASVQKKADDTASAVIGKI
jgi:bacteriocin-like protein